MSYFPPSRQGQDGATGPAGQDGQTGATGPAGTGAGSPAGTNGQLQWNNNGVLAGDTATTDGSGNMVVSTIRGSSTGTPNPNEGITIYGSLITNDQSNIHWNYPFSQWVFISNSGSFANVLAGQLTLNSGTTAVTLACNGQSASPWTFNFPLTGGTVGYVLSTDGSGGTSWVSPQSGATGPAGSNGSNGGIGATGATGQTGDVGATGPAGADGADGADGAVGATGARGAAGAAGADGAVGATGPQGPAGNDGTNGSNGAIGATGPQGPAGSSYDQSLNTTDSPSFTGMAVSGNIVVNAGNASMFADGTINGSTYKVGGVAGFIGTGVFTTFTIVGGIITAAS